MYLDIKNKSRINGNVYDEEDNVGKNGMNLNTENKKKKKCC